MNTPATQHDADPLSDTFWQDIREKERRRFLEWLETVSSTHDFKDWELTILGGFGGYKSRAKADE